MTFQKIRIVMSSIVLAITLGLASVAIAQEPSQQGVVPLGQMNIEQLTKAIADARLEINNAIQQAEVYPAHRNECLDNRDSWRVELMSLQDALIRRLQSDLGTVTSDRDGLRTQLASVTGERDRLQAAITAATAQQSGSPERPETAIRVDVQQTTATVGSGTPPPPPPPPGQGTEGNSQPQPQPDQSAQASQPPYGLIGGGVLALLLVFLALNYKYEWVMADKIQEHKLKRAVAKELKAVDKLVGEVSGMVQTAGTIGGNAEGKMKAVEGRASDLRKQATAAPTDTDLDAAADEAEQKVDRMQRAVKAVYSQADNVKECGEKIGKVTNLEAAKAQHEKAKGHLEALSKANEAFLAAENPPAPKK